MYKHTQRVVLKSPYFKIKNQAGTKQRSSSKSPHHNCLKSTVQPTVDPNDIFQKVCCPNCRYLFKTIKSIEVFDKKKMETKTIQIQTEERYLIAIKKLFQNYSQSVTQKIPIYIHQLIDKSSHYKQYKNNNSVSLNKSTNNRSSSNIQQHLKQSTYKFQALTLKDKNKQGNQNQLKKSQQKPSFLSWKNINEKIRKQTDKISYVPKNQSYMKLIQTEVSRYLMDAYQLQKQVNELYNFCHELPLQMQIPSFCKMLFKNSQRANQNNNKVIQK